MVAKPGDLQDTAKPDPIDNNYYNVTILDLDPSVTTELYLDIQLAWLYKDITKGPDGNGISPYSTPIRIPLPFETLNPPKFVSSDLTIYQGKIKVNWQGTDNTSTPYAANLDYIDVLYKKSSDSTWASAGILKKAGSILIPGTPKLTYNVKLVAYSTLGKSSADSEIQSIQLIGSGPNQPTNVTRAWDGDSFVVTFDQSPSASGNEFLSYHKIKLVSSTNVEKIIDFAVQPTTSQKFSLSASDGNTFFGPQTSLSYSGEVWSVDIFGIESLHSSFTSLGYTSPLTAPTITLTQLVGGYKVAYTDQLTDQAKLVFNNISIEESLTSSTSGFSRVSFGSTNPTTISTGTSIAQRWVRALVYDNVGGYPKNPDQSPLYSNVATVTPKSADITDTTPPGVPSVSAGTTTYNSIPLTITVTDADTKAVYVRYKKSIESIYTYYNLPVVSGSNSYTIKGLLPNTQYNIAVSGGDSFSNYSAYSTDINSTTAVSVPGVATSVTVSALNSGVGILASWTAPASSPTLITKYKVELYKDPAGTNTLQQTQYSFSTNISFSGLSASTVYKVLVYSQDEFGIFASSASSSNFTTNTAGGLSDGLAPSSSPTPTVTPLYGALEVRWTGVTNADTVTYEVHASTTSGFTPSLSTKILEVTGTFAIIKTIGGTALTYGTTYYVKLIAKDVDGSATAGSQGSGAPSAIDNGDIAANAIRANVIQAGTITGNEINGTSLFVSKSFQVGTGGIIYSGTGAVFNNANTGFYLDSAGQFSLKDKLSFTTGGVLTVNGVINADSGDLKGALTVNSGTMKIGKAVQSTNDGIYINANNYWYSSGLFRAGGSGTGITSDGTNVSITSSVTITGTSSITGNLGVTGTIYSGSSATSGNRVVMNTSGIFAYDNSATPLLTTQIISTAAAGGITFATEAARLGSSGQGWTVKTNTIENAAGGGSVKLESSTSNARITVSPAAASSTTGMSASDTYAFWAGAAATSGTSTSLQIAAAPFTVTHAGAIVANSATIRGTIKAESGGFGTYDTSGNLTSGFTLTSGQLSSSTGSLVINGTTGAITGGSITGTTISGGIIQTSSSASERKIVIDSTLSKDAILFKGIASDATTGDGRISVGFGLTLNSSDPSPDGTTFTNAFPSLTMSAPTVTTSGATAYPAKIAMSNSPSGGVMEINATWTRMRGYVELLNGFDYLTQAVRMISAGTATPSSTMGKEGSIYFQIG
jgi:hypothetical protein